MAEHPASTQYKTYGKPRAIRLDGWDYATPCLYHVTLSTDRRARWFAVAEHAGIFVDALRAQVQHTAYHVPAFCVMPDHVHILCQPNIEHPISLIAFVQHLKRRSTHAMRTFGVAERIWQRGFYDHILRREEDALVVIDYILNNPVRAGLVEDFSVYPYSFGQEIKAYTGPRDVIKA